MLAQGHAQLIAEVNHHSRRGEAPPKRGLLRVDVRQPGETEGGTIPDATEIPLTILNQLMSTLDPSKPTVVYCAGGYRSSIAASMPRSSSSP